MSNLVLNDVPTVDFDLFSRDFVNDPYPTLEKIRSAGRIVRHEGMGHYLLTGYRDCARAMGQGDLFRADVENIGMLFGGPPFAGMEGQKHNEFKSIWARDLRRKSILDHVEVIADIVRKATAETIERARAGEVVDAVAGFTRNIPTIVIAHMMDLPSERVAEFIEWTDTMGGIMEGRDDPSPRGRELVANGVAATGQMNDFVSTIIEDRKLHRGEDLVSRLVHTDVPIAESEMVSASTQLVFAGNETTSKLMGLSLIALAKHPKQREELRRDRSLMPQAIEEIHRWTSVKNWSVRFLKQDAEIGGVELPAGTSLMAMQAAANRDPERWENPQVLDIHRPTRAHLGFGTGPHTCMGLNLARLEVATVLNTLLDTIPDWEVSKVDFGLGPMIRGPIEIGLSSPSARN
ncbi:cytochrome P450 [Nocardioides sp. L-11A]|uniref:cytochrome P450 n=1 Tax=Nocardioides sp. L-11A TaxID=3043848 RepID=UPI00249A8D3E|nr:cytochrome P450 [Nocardioides sp. L-11A]